MPLKLLSSGGGSVLLTANTTASDFTVNVPAVNGNMVTTADTGSITQAMLGAGVYAGYGPAFSAYNNATQAITGNVNTKVSLQVEEFDTANCFDNTTNYRFTPNVAGYYMFTAAVEIATVSNAWYLLKLYKNGSVHRYGSNFASSAGGYPCSNLSAMTYLNGSTDYVELYAIAAGNSTINTGGTAVCYFQGYLVRAA